MDTRVFSTWNEIEFSGERKFHSFIFDPITRMEGLPEPDFTDLPDFSPFIQQLLHFAEYTTYLTDTSKLSELIIIEMKKDKSSLHLQKGAVTSLVGILTKSKEIAAIIIKMGVLEHLIELLEKNEIDYTFVDLCFRLFNVLFGN